MIIIISAQAHAEIIYANSCSRADIQAAHDSASDGDIIMIPAGDCTWDSPFMVIVSKAVSFQGAGPSQTILRKTSSLQYYGMFDCYFDTAPGPTGVSFSGMKLIGEGSEIYLDSGIFLRSGYRNFQIHDCVFEGFGSAGIIIDARKGNRDLIRQPWGVIYNCTFTDCYKLGNGYGVCVVGDDSWEDPLVLGSYNAVFVEDCHFSGCRHVIASNIGSKYVFRYNTCENNRGNADCDAHGWSECPECSSGYNHGSRSYEIYENTFSRAESTECDAVNVRGGDGVVFNNTLTNFGGNDDDSEGLFFCNEDCPGCAYPCPDQVRDAYIWGNTNNGQSINGVPTNCQHDGGYIIREDRDIFNYEKPGYVPYTYPHPLRTNNNLIYANINAFPTSGEVPLTVNFTGNATEGTSPYSYSWNFGDDTSSSEQNPSHTYNDAGDYTVTLTVTDSQSSQDSESLTINAYAYVPPVDETGPWDETAKKGDCFIVTATYGSPLHPYVKILQDFRDKYLMPIKLGREIVNFYYKYSPFVADLIAKHTALKFAVQINLLPLVIFSYSMVHFGPIITGIILVSIFVLQVFLILFLRTKITKRSRKVL